MIALAPYFAGCALLVIAGIAKAVDPNTTAIAVAPRVRISAHRLRPVIRGLAATEALLGGIAITWPGRGSATLVALSYAGFAGFVLVVRASGGPLASCGCFGTPDTPATGLHVVLDGAFAVAAVAVALQTPAPSLDLPLLLTSAAGAWCALLVLTRLPQLGVARRLLLEGGDR